MVFAGPACERIFVFQIVLAATMELWDYIRQGSMVLTGPART